MSRKNVPLNMKLRRNSLPPTAPYVPVTTQRSSCRGRFRSLRTMVVVRPMAQYERAIERFQTKGVERMMMRRAKMILSLLMPAFWLAGSLGSFSDQVTFPAAGAPGAFLCATGHKRDISTCASSFDQAIRRAPRRPTIQPGTDNVSTPGVVAEAQVQLINPSFTSLDCSRDTCGLAQSWQLHPLVS